MAVVNQNSSVWRNHPVLYWVTVAYMVGVPNFIKFDGTGRTHDLGLFNLTSISRIALTLFTAYMLAINLAMARGPIFPRRVKIPIGVWISLLAWYIIATVLQPPSRLSPHLASDLPLSLFRLGQWVLGFMLFLVLYSREPAEDATALVVELIGRSSWITVLMVWMILPIAPHLAYSVTDEPGSVATLGGWFVDPGELAFQSGCAFLYSLFFVRRAYFRWLGCFLAFISLAMTRARTSQMGFILAVGCYAFVYCRKPALRWASGGLLILIGGLATVYSRPLMAYMARGQSIENIATLDSRALIWRACWSAIQQRPILGYGYIIGAKDAIRDHWVYSSQWVPPHAHNDLIQATLQGGFPASMLMIYLYVWLFGRCVRAARVSREHLFLFLLVIQLTVIASTGLVLSCAFSSLSAVLVLCHIGFAQTDAQPVPAWEISRQRGSPFAIAKSATPLG